VGVSPLPLQRLEEGLDLAVPARRVGRGEDLTSADAIELIPKGVGAIWVGVERRAQAKSEPGTAPKKSPAYSLSPAASRALPSSITGSIRTIFCPRKVQSMMYRFSPSMPLARPLPC
jgi:hypothetical protein